jgi:hypothetical protein
MRTPPPRARGPSAYHGRASGCPSPLASESVGGRGGTGGGDVRSGGGRGSGGGGGERGGLLSREHAGKAFDLLDVEQRGELPPSAVEYGLHKHHYLRERLELTTERRYATAASRPLSDSKASF